MIFANGIGPTERFLGPLAGGASAGAYAAYALALDFQQAIYVNNGSAVGSLSNMPGYTYTRSGIKSELSSSGAILAYAANVPGVVPSVGYWPRASATNVLLNAGQASNLATQGVSVTAQAYTLSFMGTGTVTLSGAYTGSLVGTGASNRVWLSFTPAAGTLTLTVTGTVTYSGLVAGLVPGPIISTAGTAATVGKDAMTMGTPNIPESDFYAQFVFTAAVTGDRVFTVGRLAGTGVGENYYIQMQKIGTYYFLAYGIGNSQIGVLSNGATPWPAGRIIVVLRRKAGQCKLFVRAGATNYNTADFNNGFPAGGISSLDVGHIPGTAAADVAMEKVLIKLGTYTDADINAIMEAA